MSLHVGNKNINEVYYGGKSIAEIYSGSKLVWQKKPGEYFKFSIDSGNNATFGIPLLNTNAQSEDAETPSVDWIIDWGDGVIERKEMGAGPRSFIEHTYPQANKEYTITIKPFDQNKEGWGKCFGFSTTYTPYKSQIRKLLSPITKNMWFDDRSNNYLGWMMFYGCTNLTMGEKFNLPQDEDVYTVGSDFCNGMFSECINLNMSTIFNLPQNIQTVKNNFCSGMFTGCRNLNMNSVFQLPLKIMKFPAYFCTNMFQECIKLKLNSVIKLPSATSAAAQEYYCSRMFQGCSSITTGVQRLLSTQNLSTTALNRTAVFDSTFSYCTGITEEISAETIQQLKTVPKENNNCFTGASEIARAKCPVNWGGIFE